MNQNRYAKGVAVGRFVLVSSLFNVLLLLLFIIQGYEFALIGSLLLSFVNILLSTISLLYVRTGAVWICLISNGLLAIGYFILWLLFQDFCVIC